MGTRACLLCGAADPGCAKLEMFGLSGWAVVCSNRNCQLIGPRRRSAAAAIAAWQDAPPLPMTKKDPGNPGRRLGEGLLLLGMPQTAFARATGYNPSQITDVVHGRTRLSEKLALRAERKVGIRAHWLLYGEGERLLASEGSADA